MCEHTARWTLVKLHFTTHLEPEMAPPDILAYIWKNECGKIFSWSFGSINKSYTTGYNWLVPEQDEHRLSSGWAGG